jgi:hypothetical protein
MQGIEMKRLKEENLQAGNRIGKKVTRINYVWNRSRVRIQNLTPERMVCYQVAKTSLKIEITQITQSGNLPLLPCLISFCQVSKEMVERLAGIFGKIGRK